MSTRYLTYLALLVAQGLALAFLEGMLPAALPVPGAKLGLANAITLVALYTLPRWQEALWVVLLRVGLASVFWGGPSVLMYSLAGALGSLAVMQLLKRLQLDIMLVSTAGGLAHNLCQLALAMLVLRSTALCSLLPWLCLAGLASGAAIGWLGERLLAREIIPRPVKA